MSLLSNIVQKSDLEKTLEKTEAIVIDQPTPSEVVIKTTILKGTEDYPEGLKVFINLTHSSIIPEPETWDQSEILKAINGNPETKFCIPLSLSEPRADRDKSGKLCLVFDCCVNSDLITKLMPPVSTLQESSGDNLKDDFKLYITELCMEFVEERYLISLSRKFSYPRMSCKGTPVSHTFFRTQIENSDNTIKNKINKKSLIEEVNKTENKNNEEEEEDVPIPTIDVEAEPEIHEPTVSTEESVKIHEPYVGLKRPNTVYKEERHRHLLEIDLPGVTSAKDIILDVCTSHILVSIPGKYHFMGRVRNTVILDNVNADFDDTLQKLAVKLPTKRTEMPNSSFM